jgi:hypothetical protein
MNQESAQSALLALRSDAAQAIFKRFVRKNSIAP